MNENEKKQELKEQEAAKVTGGSASTELAYICMTCGRSYNPSQLKEHKEAYGHLPFPKF